MCVRFVGEQSGVLDEIATPRVTHSRADNVFGSTGVGSSIKMDGIVRGVYRKTVLTCVTRFTTHLTCFREFLPDSHSLQVRNTLGTSFSLPNGSNHFFFFSSYSFLF